MKNKNGFTLIELLAVVTIVGILMLLAIPMVTRVIENSREVSFVDTAKSYANSAKNLWMSDNLTCNGVAPSALHDGDYYIFINTLETAQERVPKLLENGGKSSWGNKDLNGYVRVNIKTTPPIDSDGDGVYEKESKREIKYYVALSDGLHGVLDNNDKVSGNVVKKDIVKQLSTEEIKKIELTDNYGRLDCGLETDDTYVCTEVTPVTDITAVCTDLYSTAEVTGNVKYPPVNFATDEWSTIVEALKSGSHPYHVGDVKDVDLGTFGMHKIRIANLSTPTECALPDFSKTACGAVLEFADIINLNSIGSGSNTGSWPARSLRSFVNNDIYNALPVDLRNGIIDTKVVSGYGGRTGESSNFTSTDKLYFLSTAELWTGGITGDTAYFLSRQLDYYAGANSGNYENPICVKQYNGVNQSWWLRTPYSGNSYLFSISSSNGGYSNNPMNMSNGVSPAFRISYVEPTLPENFSKFESDSWETVISNLKSGYHPYKIGDTKQVDMGSFGKHTVRLANLSKPASCNNSSFSQTACGIVFEFSDIILSYRMKSGSPTNKNGWPSTPLRTYLNRDIYNALPSVLKNAIINTKAVSGHGSTAGESNFTSTDKLYFLSTAEVWKNGASDYDIATSSTRQLDYYEKIGVTTYNHSGASKKMGNSNYSWWLRTAAIGNDISYVCIGGNGGRGSASSNNLAGVSPAFRIG